MKIKIAFIERKRSSAVSIEKVFRQVAKSIEKNTFEVSFYQIPYLSTITGIIKNFLFFRKPNADVFHISGDIHYLGLILPVANTVLTIHDLRFLYVRKGIRRFILKKLFLDLPVKRLRYITAISTNTKNEILKHLNCNPDKIRVIENPLNGNIFFEKKKEFNTNKPTLLQIGTAPNKNLKNLFEAVKDISCNLKIIGKLDQELIKILEKYKIEYKTDFDLKDEQMRLEYQKADIVMFCSTFEGFGLPIIEAQATGTPVITSNISPLKEVAGGGALLVDPLDFQSIKDGIVKMIYEEQIRNSLIENGLANVNRFNPKLVAEEYEKLYLKVMEGNNKSQ